MIGHMLMQSNRASKWSLIGCNAYNSNGCNKMIIEMSTTKEVSCENCPNMIENDVLSVVHKALASYST